MPQLSQSGNESLEAPWRVAGIEFTQEGQNSWDLTAAAGGSDSSNRCAEAGQSGKERQAQLLPVPSLSEDATHLEDKARSIPLRYFCIWSN